MNSRTGPVLDLREPVRLDAWAITLATGIVAGTVAPTVVPAILAACIIFSVAALAWRSFVAAEWRLMVIAAPLFAGAGVGISFLHTATPDPLAQLAALEPGEVVIVGSVASPPVASSWGYRADVRVEHLWYGGKEILRGGGVEVFAGDLSVGVGDRMRVDGEISRPRPGEDGFDYAR
ncbi:MAG TPA: ComEC/Rec2 family competence protein, partial [Rubrobacteraceae bacterium]|nr:ComEC/Rec2 family competence protein [Rubrobacteraceae bacterium]